MELKLEMNTLTETFPQQMKDQKTKQKKGLMKTSEDWMRGTGETSRQKDDEE